jgi:superoxide dismutase, Fe-Mn family
MNAHLTALSRDSSADAPQDMVPAMALALAASFGSVAAWRDDFITISRAPASGAGWLVLAFDAQQGRLINERTDQDQPLRAAAVPILALAQPTAAAADVQAFVTHIAWGAVYERYQHAVHAASDGWAADPQQLGPAMLLDVRRAGIFEKVQTMLPGARWLDPAQVGDWSATLPHDRAVVVYCIYGHEVGRSMALRLRAEGIDARFLPGGIDAWTLAGKPLVAKEPKP